MFLRNSRDLHPCYSTWLSVVAFEVAFLSMSPLCPCCYALHVTARLRPLLSPHPAAYLQSLALSAPGSVWTPAPGIQNFESLGSTLSSFWNSFSVTCQLPCTVLAMGTRHLPILPGLVVLFSLPKIVSSVYPLIHLFKKAVHFSFSFELFWFPFSYEFHLKAWHNLVLIKYSKLSVSCIPINIRTDTSIYPQN